MGYYITYQYRLQQSGDTTPFLVLFVKHGLITVRTELQAADPRRRSAHLLTHSIQRNAHAGFDDQLIVDVPHDKAMGALEMGLAEEELQPLVDMWRASNPHIVQFWWAVDAAVKSAVNKRVDTEVCGIKFLFRSGMLFIILPSGRRLCYVRPKMGLNQFGGDSITYEGVGATKKWERIESYGPKFVENIVQAVSRDILMYAIRTLSHCFIVGHVHDELIIEASMGVSLDAVCEQMGRTPPWIIGLKLRADGYETMFYRKD